MERSDLHRPTEEGSDESSEDSEFDAFHESLYLKIDSLIMLGYFMYRIHGHWTIMY